MERELFAAVQSRRQSIAGFTLMELLVVIAVIGILAAIAIPQFAQYRAKGFEGRAKADLRHVATAEEAYFVDYQVYKSCSDSACVTALPGVNALSTEIVLQITATTSGFTGTASHPQIDVTCQWDNSLQGFLGCS